MRALFLDRWNNWFWHQWSPSFPEQSYLSRISQIIVLPLLALGSISIGSLVALRNRVQSKPVFSDSELRIQFSSLTDRPSYVSEKGAERHLSRNRYSDVVPFDHNRVRLKGYPEFYFNASRVLGGKAIASQGPLPNELYDLWKMIWEEECSLLVMLTNCRENGVDKCAEYWAIVTKNFAISKVKEEILFKDSGAKIVKRIFNVKKGKETKTFTQLHLVDWPDHGVVSPEMLKKLVLYADQEKEGSGPILAHCSAGIGRTGTFLAAYEAFLTKSKVVFGIVDSLRHERTGMVQKKEQYILAQRAAELLA